LTPTAWRVGGSLIFQRIPGSAGWAAARRPSSPTSGNAQAMVDAVRKAFGDTDYARKFTDRVLAGRELQVGI